MRNILKLTRLQNYLFLGMIFLLTAATEIYGQNIQPKDVVSVKAFVTNDSSKVNGFIYADVNLEIKDGWHINANKPLDDYLTPTTVSIKSSNDIKVVKIKYPAPLLMKLSFSETDLALYEDQATVKIVLKAVNPKKLKGQKLKGEIQYQPCDNQTCLFPVTKEFSLNLSTK